MSSSLAPGPPGISQSAPDLPKRGLNGPTSASAHPLISLRSMRDRGVLVGVLVAALALLAAACGSSSSGPAAAVRTTQTTVTLPPASSTTSPPTADAAVTTAPPPPAPATTTPPAAVPSDLVGERLDVAEYELKNDGISYTEVGGGAFGIIVKSNWIVCQTQPAGGQPVSGSVALIVDHYSCSNP